ncbi:GAF domain-containing hybrid sensor histidine kinase/response regulator [Spirosoma radiotolerans]|uniref:GAF domain-containing hybrid sensor histidine kinase/response regulator n=1 Tax=Spirosoma radiotolerans TaxID=1379870 RepID=UPI0006988BA9|nr:response regulator [Spirosoma radiotolerans]
MIKSLTGRIYFGTALTFLTVPVIILLYFSAFRRHDALLAHSTQIDKITEHIANLEVTLLELKNAPQNGTAATPAAKTAPSLFTVSAIERNLSELRNLLASEPSQFNRFNWVEKETIAYLSGNTSQLKAIREQLNQIKQQARHDLLARQEKEADTDYMEECAMWVAVLVAVVNIAILILVIFEEFRKRRRAERELKENVAKLQSYNQESEERNWQLTGLSAISHSLQDQDSPQDIARKIIVTLTDHLDLPAGAVYLFNSDERRLERVASIGLPADVPSSFGLGEGLVGQASQGLKILIVNQIPTEYWELKSGSGEAQPGQLVLVPLWYRKDRELIGVLELAAFRTLEPTAITLLKRLMEPLAVAINSAQTHLQVRALLEQVQRQNELVANQQEELRQSNESLIRQAESLQESEEELIVQQEELRQINAELVEKNETVEIARQSLSLKARELEVSSQYKSAFLANMSHELRTPLNSVLILAKLLADNKPDNLTPKQIEYANVIHKSGNDLLELINDILDLAKIEAGHINVQREPVSVKSVVRDLSQLFMVVAEEKKVELITTIHESVPREITTDRLRLEQILKNLLSNAFKFTPANGRVTLTFAVASNATLTRQELRREESLVAISVSDTGIGIPPDKQQLIFEAFQQVDGSTSRKYGGTGLGLSISRELIKRLGGEITLQSEEGVGSTFTIWLPPVGTEPVPAESVEVKADKAYWNANANSSQPTPLVQQDTVSDDRDNLKKGDKVMLIIEDDIRFATIVRDFSQSKGYKTLVALQGDEGLAYARRYEPSAIILDLQLPVLDGMSVLRILKDDAHLKHIPVHVISANDAPKQALPGALAYIQKPLKKQDLDDAFTRISNRIAEQLKNVLVLSGDYLPDDSLTKLINERHFDITCDYAVLDDKALQRVHDKAYDCVIADIGKDLNQGIQKLRQLQEAMPTNQIPVIIYLDNELSSFDELQLKKLSDTVVHDSVQAKDRLMDQLELFLYKVQERNGMKPLPTPESQPAPAHTNWEGKTVLLVDDDMRNVFSISTLLEEQKLTVITASDGQEALDTLNEQPQVDLILMDIMMPNMDGYEATRRIRLDNRFTELPIIALTAKAMPGDREKCLEAGASDYITKPLDINQLQAKMHVWIPA